MSDRVDDVFFSWPCLETFVCLFCTQTILLVIGVIQLTLSRNFFFLLLLCLETSFGNRCNSSGLVY